MNNENTSTPPTLKEFLMTVSVILGLAFIPSYFMSSCSSQPESLESLERQVDPETQARFDKGPKFQGGCYKIISKDNIDRGCTFLSTQGSMFVKGAFLKPDSENISKWRVVVNKTLKCDGNVPYFVDEDHVKKIKCPKSVSNHD